MIWISVKHRLPVGDGGYLIYKWKARKQYHSMEILYYSSYQGTFLNCDKTKTGSQKCFNGDNITHWMPLPDPPEKKNDNQLQ